ncbi:MAG: phage major capsid protein [Chloroflexi bacterium]|nr:phage major capsid protein [Chloroflexota bacterium]
MALTLVEAAKLSNDVVLAGVIETVVYESETLQRLPFIELNGNALTYNRENTASTASWYAVGATWSESTPDFTQVTANLTILGHDADVDNYIRQTRSNVQDVEAAILALAAKSVAQEFDNQFINGDGTGNKITGLKSATPAAQQVAQAANGATLTLAKLDEMIDKVRPGKPHALIMSKRSRRKLKELRRGQSAAVIETSMGAFGQMVTTYDGIPVTINEWQSDTETKGAGSATSSTIYALQFGEGAIAGLTNGGIQLERIGSLETRDATRTRLKWYVGLAIFNTLKLAYLDGVQD